MKIFAIFDKNDKLIICFPTREEAETYGKEVLGVENGWEYSIKEKFLHNSPLTTIPPYTTRTPQQTIPCKVSDVPYTPPITVPSPPYSPNIWCGVKANEWNETGDGV
jgi:hypothetical protein